MRQGLYGEPPVSLLLLLILLAASLAASQHRDFHNLAELRERLYSRLPPSRLSTTTQAPGQLEPATPAPQAVATTIPACTNATARSLSVSLAALVKQQRQRSALYIIAHDEASLETALMLVACFDRESVSVRDSRRVDVRAMAGAVAVAASGSVLGTPTPPASVLASTSVSASEQPPKLTPLPVSAPAPAILIPHDALTPATAWLRIEVIPSTPFFESAIYPLLAARQPEWAQLDYVMVTTYKTMSQKGQTLEEVSRLLGVAARGGWDVVPFLRSGSGMMSNCLYWHKKPFKLAWDGILTALNFTYPDVRKHYEMKPFFRNAFIANTSTIQQLGVFMSRAIKVAGAAEVAKLLERDSNYKEGSASTATKIFGTTYYQLHPFIFERLPSFFLHHHQARLCHDTAGDCAYNT